ncbi:MAG: UDP-2,3-diacylglucosamine diphosphatase LpxI, partial [Candidatus Omnitrophica bacterium]|nr:UDP-2,3-diacylglucosamine diphosphatase LpxI [Candidatus Omnitrophota bacterium]
LEKIGLFAGAGDMPIVFGDEARKGGTKVVAFAAKDITSSELEKHVDKIYWINPSDTGKLPLMFLAERLRNFVALGSIPKTLIFKKDFSDSKEISSLINDTEDRVNDKIMRKIADIGKKFGINFVNPTDFLPNLLLKKGTATKREPTPKEQEDIEFGIQISHSIGDLGIGQTAIIKNKSIVSVEAMEGTDDTIKRAARLVGAGTVCVKLLTPTQDPRFDIPTIGMGTMNALVEAKTAVLVVDAEKALIINREDVIAKADANGVSIVAI